MNSAPKQVLTTEQSGLMSNKSGKGFMSINHGSAKHDCRPNSQIISGVNLMWQ